MHLPIHISPTDGVPIYQQIVQQVKYLVASGRLEPDAELPPIRTLAEQLVVNPNTVARAFQNLEREGIIRTVPGGGTYVASFAASGAGLLKTEKIRRLRPLVDQIAVEASQLRLSSEDLHKLLDTALLELEKARRVRKSDPKIVPQEGDR